MPSKSPAQARLMRAVAHGWKKPGGGGPSQAVAQEFVDADQMKEQKSLARNVRKQTGVKYGNS